jgi:hypothetical protein
MAPRRPLVTFGISTHCISDAIDEADTLGLVDCRRGRRRIASVYALNWLPLMDGTPAGNRWRSYRNPTLADPEGEILSAEVHSKGSAEVHSKPPVMSAEVHSKPPDSLSAEVHSPSRRSSYQGGADYSGVGGRGERAPANGDARRTWPARAAKP